MFRIAAPAVCAFVAGATARAARPITFDDIMAMRGVSDALAAPDGSAVLYAARRWEPPAPDPLKVEQRSHIWKVSARGSDAPPLTYHAGATAQAVPPDVRYLSSLSSRGEAVRKTSSR